MPRTTPQRPTTPVRPDVFPFPVGTRVTVSRDPRMPRATMDDRDPTPAFFYTDEHGVSVTDGPVTGTVTRIGYDNGAHETGWDYPGVFVTRDDTRVGNHRGEWRSAQYVCPTFLTAFAEPVSLIHPRRGPLCVNCESERVSFGREFWCDDCGIACERMGRGCAGWVFGEDAIEMQGTRYSDSAFWCEPCADRYGYSCGHCDVRVIEATGYCDGCGSTCRTCTDELDYCDPCDAHYCGSSHDECDYNDDGDSDSYGSGSSSINSYSYRPRLEFRGTDSSAFLGVEIEIQAAGSLAQYITEKSDGLIYCKEDGSVSRGFEMVSHPMTYAWFMANFPFDAMRHMAAQGASGSVHGIHVHISRGAFDSRDHVRRWLDLLYGNTEKVQAIARRVSTEWASFSDWHRIEEKAAGNRGSTRYAAVNAQNDATLEVRIFLSSLDPEEIQAALGLVSASCEYTRSLPTDTGVAVFTPSTERDQNGGYTGVATAVLPDVLTWAAFAEWVGSRPEYAPLYSQMFKLTGITGQLALDLAPAEFVAA